MQIWKQTTLVYPICFYEVELSINKKKVDEFTGIIDFLLLGILVVPPENEFYF